MKFKKQFVSLSVAASIIFGGSFVITDTASAEKSLSEVKQEQKDVKAKKSKVEAELSKVINKVNEINEKIERLETAIKENNTQIDKTDKKIVKLEKEIDRLHKEIDAINLRIEERNDVLLNRISSYQENGGNIQFMEVIFGAKDPLDFISRIEAVTTMTGADQEIINEQEKDKELVVEKEAETTKKLEQQEDALAELEEIKATTEQQKDEAAASKKELNKEVNKLNDTISKYNIKEKDLKAIENRLTAPPVEVLAQTITNNNNSSNNSNGNAASNQSNSASNTDKKADTPAPQYNGTGGSAISAGKQYIGRSTYVFGAKDPSRGLFDCSGFVSWAYEQEGISLPRNTDGMAGTGSAISLSQAQAGDLVFFDTYKKNGHVGIYLGGGQFLGSQTGKGVEIVSMNNSYWKGTFSGHVRRVK